jgi:hypothetical protein
MTHEWTMINEDVIPLENGYINVIKTIWFEVKTTEEREVRVRGRINLDRSQMDQFIDYDQVNDSIRLQWIKNKYGEDYENYNISQLQGEI